MNLSVVLAMIRFGGGFVQHLGGLWMLGEPDNRRRIKAAWPEYRCRASVTSTFPAPSIIRSRRTNRQQDRLVNSFY